jgi:hypothetical protein
MVLEECVGEVGKPKFLLEEEPFVGSLQLQPLKYQGKGVLPLVRLDLIDTTVTRDAPSCMLQEVKLQGLLSTIMLM